MPTFADGKIEAHVGPPGLGAADDLESVIVEFIAGARTKLDIAVQELDSDAIAKAILAASWRGVRVTLFLEQDYLRTSLKRDTTTHVPIPPVPKPGETPEQALERVQWLEDDTDLSENRRILAALLRSDVEVRGHFNPEIFHQKFVLRDYDEGKATSPGNPALLSFGFVDRDSATASAALCTHGVPSNGNTARADSANRLPMPRPRQDSNLRHPV